MTTRRPTNALGEAELEALFQAADLEAPLPSADLMTRILADAETQQRQASAPPLVPVPLLTRLRETLGGWAGLSGLAGAAAVGLVVGLFPPAVLSEYASSFTGGAASFSDYLPGADLNFEIGGIDG